jgi:hypothetical protein
VNSRASKTSLDRFMELRRRAAAGARELRGAFHPEPHELDFGLPPSLTAGTIVLFGFTGGAQWHVFAGSVEACDGLPHPLDRWSRHVLGPLAREFDALDFYPNGTPQLPFQRLAARCEPVHPSPIGLLIHPQWGLWHSYRGALLLNERIGLPAMTSSAHPCQSCASKPCLSACPVGAFRSGAFDLDACVNHVQSAAGSDCREQGCRARRACPVGVEFSYREDQARFHMTAYLRSVERDHPAILPAAVPAAPASDGAERGLRGSGEVAAGGRRR